MCIAALSSSCPSLSQFFYMTIAAMWTTVYLQCVLSKHSSLWCKQPAGAIQMHSVASNLPKNIVMLNLIKSQNSIISKVSTCSQHYIQYEVLVSVFTKNIMQSNFA